MWVGNNFGKILAQFCYLQVRGPPRRYFPNPNKSILVVAPRNVAIAKEFFRGVGLKVVTGSRYLGNFIDDQEEEITWLVRKVQGWTDLVRTLLGVAQKHPQSAYTGLQKSLAQEWAFMHRITPDIGDAFRPV